MDVDADYGNTLMHVSGNFITANVGEQVKPFIRHSASHGGKRSEEFD
jgi:hypothetical protein